MANESLRERAVNVAVGEDGTLAAKGSRRWGQRIGVYLASIGLKQGHDYCIAFVYWCFDQAAKQVPCRNPVPRTGSPSTIYNFASQGGLLVSSPRRGDIYLTRALSHGGIIEITPGANQLAKCCTIEGNTYIGDHLWGVHRRRKDLSDAYFVRV